MLAFLQPYCVLATDVPATCPQRPVAVSKDAEAPRTFSSWRGTGCAEKPGRDTEGRGWSSSVVPPEALGDLSSWAQRAGMWGPRRLGWGASVGAVGKGKASQSGGQRSFCRKEARTERAPSPWPAQVHAPPPPRGGCCWAPRWSPVVLRGRIFTGLVTSPHWL